MGNKKAMSDIEVLSYSTVHQYYRRIIRQMHLDNYKPDYVIALERGGADIGVKFSHYFKVPVTFIKWYTRDTTEKHVDLLQECLNNNIDKNILVVDDICDSGATFEGVKKFTSNSTKFATIIENMDNSFECDWSGRSIYRSTEPQWFQFPWENFWDDDTK